MNAEWSDERRMEWQADNIAPRILMPIQTFKPMVDELYQRFGYDDHSRFKTEILECVIEELAVFYKVSKQSAKFRMVELGYVGAREAYNYEDGSQPYFSNISPRDAFYEYCDNEKFRDIVDSGLFVYADEYFVINDEKYVTVESGGAYSLTDYAWNNLAECTLQFTYRCVNMPEHGKFHTDTFHRVNKEAFQNLPSYEPDRNVSVIGNAEELRRKQEQFESDYETHRALTPTFWERAHEIMEAKHWNTTIFCEKTGLEAIVYSRIKNNPDSNPKIRTVISICAGLDLDINMTDELLGLAGHRLSISREDQALAFAITGFRGKPIEERSAFLESLDFAPLGSIQRK
jgi:hypothetical protein